MKRGELLTKFLLFALLLCFAQPSRAAPMDMAFTYQGRLIDINEPADGEYDLMFSIYDACDLGTILFPAAVFEGIDILDGYFTVDIPVPIEAFEGSARLIEIGVRPGILEDPNA
ncbi:MAG: hypothetical protein ACYTBV_14540, partial [Planctomycetota bacterium]